MIRKFATVLILLLLVRAAAHAQETPAGQQPPAGQPPATPAQENPEEESTSRRKARPHDYRNWTFNAGGGANLPSGTTRTFVKGGGGVAGAGVARNFNKYFGFRLDFLWADLPLRTSALQSAQAPGASNHVYSLMLDPIFNIPVTKKYTGYFVIGPGFYHRSGKLDSSTAVPGSACNAFYTWWGTCFNGSLPLSGKFLNESQNEVGINFGGGVARKVKGNLEIYGEFRYLHGKRNNITTDLRPITIGVRW
jgi:opacity protein-like surface antigen